MMENKDDRVLDEKQWQIEAEAVIRDVQKHVNVIRLSSKLRSTNQSVYLNLTTLEGFQFCVELSSFGFSIVGDKHDAVSINMDDITYFETPYGLLESISPLYTQSFGEMLSEKLKKLEEQ